MRNNPYPDGPHIRRLPGGWAVAKWMHSSKIGAGKVALYWHGERAGCFGPESAALVHTSPAGLQARFRDACATTLALPDQQLNLITDLEGPGMSGHDPGQFRFLTVHQPWAELIVAQPSRHRNSHALSGLSASQRSRLPKTVENRDWGTDWRGTVLIHAGLRPDLDAMARFRLDPRHFVYGAVLGTVRLHDVRTESDDWWADPDSKKHLMLEAGHRLGQPVGCRGERGLQKPKPEVLRPVLRQLLTQPGISTVHSCSTTER